MALSTHTSERKIMNHFTPQMFHSWQDWMFCTQPDHSRRCPDGSFGSMNWMTLEAEGCHSLVQSAMGLLWYEKQHHRFDPPRSCVTDSFSLGANIGPDSTPSNSFDCLAGLVVKASALGVKDLGFESHLQQDFFRVESYQWLKIWHSSGYPARRLAL